MFVNMRDIGQIRQMIAVLTDLLTQTGTCIRNRRLALGLTQAEAGGRGVAYRTWRRLEKDGSAPIENLVRAAVALRCEEGLAGLFPGPVAKSMDALLAQQKATRRGKLRYEARPRNIALPGCCQPDGGGLLLTHAGALARNHQGMADIGFAARVAQMEQSVEHRDRGEPPRDRRRLDRGGHVAPPALFHRQRPPARSATVARHSARRSHAPLADR
jgi:transcriptional regulator with XRE-family HTH domain